MLFTYLLIKLAKKLLFKKIIQQKKGSAKSKKKIARAAANKLLSYIKKSVKGKNTFAPNAPLTKSLKRKNLPPLIESGELLTHFIVKETYFGFILTVDNLKHESGLPARDLLRILENGALVPVTPKLKSMFAARFHVHLRKRVLRIPRRPFFTSLSDSWIKVNRNSYPNLNIRRVGFTVYFSYV